MSIDSKRHEVSQNSFRSSIRPWLKNASPYCTPKGVQGPSLMDPAMNIQPLRGFCKALTYPSQSESTKQKRAPISRRALFLLTEFETIPERCDGGP